MSCRRITLTLGTAAGGLLAAAFLLMAVAFADDDGLVPVQESLIPTEVTGDPPYSPDVITGQEEWIEYDFTTGVPNLNPDASVIGSVTETIIGSMVNNDFSDGGLDVDLLTYGNGYGLEWAELPGDGIFGPYEPTIGELIITPYGDFSFGPFDFP